MSEWLHRIAHWLHWQGCRNDCLEIDGRLYHFVYCATCGKVAFYFEANVPVYLPEPPR
jgi:hypothetical protein